MSTFAESEAFILSGAHLIRRDTEVAFTAAFESLLETQLGAGSS